ncbi:MAG: hypothetical protein COB94_010215 [Gammaproteobacteria bacterium]|nr:hypothetical protein [Gammaproteobacteria bacterium]
MRGALQQAKILSPCVLWINKIEKGIQSNNEDFSVSQRVLGTLIDLDVRTQRSPRWNFFHRPTLRQRARTDL